MPLLAANFGNTHLRFGLFDEQGTIRASVRLASQADRTADEMAVLLHDAFFLQGVTEPFRGISGVCIASVVPPLHRAAREFCERYLGASTELLYIAGAIETDMPVHYDPPGALGADRFVNAYAARALYGAPMIVADFGTATTLEAIDAEGVYRGGAILPGIGMGRDALAQRAAQLRRVDLDAADELSAIGTNTVDALRSGILLGAVGAAEGMVARFAAELGVANPNVVATGGFAVTVARHSTVIRTVDADLTLKGLRLLYLRQRSSSPGGA